MTDMDINPVVTTKTYHLLDEIELSDISDRLGREIRQENEGIILRTLDLAPGERLPFTNHYRFYTW